MLARIASWIETPAAFRLGLTVTAGLLILFAWVTFRIGRPLRFSPSETGELVVVALVHGAGPSRSSAATYFEIVVRVPSGEQFHTNVGRPLAGGEHLWAVYSLARERGQLQLSSYKSCGMKACRVATPASDGR